MVHNYTVGLGNAASYAASSKPYLSASINLTAGGYSVVELSFPNVSKFVTVRNMGPTGSNEAPLRFGFSHIGVTGSVADKQNYVVLANGESYTGDFRVARMYLMTHTDGGSLNATASVIAGMTGIGYGDLGFEPLNNWSGSEGVG